MDSDRYFSVYNLKNADKKQNFWSAKNVLFGWEIFTLSPVAYITVDIKKLVSGLFHAGSTLVESEYIKRKARLTE